MTEGMDREFETLVESIPGDALRARMLGSSIGHATAEQLPYLAEQSALLGDDFPSWQTSNLARRWIGLDSLAASEWIGSLDPGNRKDEAIAQLVSSLSDGKARDYEAAFAWAMETSKADARERTIAQIFPDWHKANAEAAKQSLRAADISDTLREALLAPAELP